MGPERHGKIRIVAPELPVAGHAAGQTHIPGGNQPLAVGPGVFLPQAGIDIEHSAFRQGRGERRVEGMEPLHNGHAAGTVDVPLFPGGKLGEEVKDRRVALPGFRQALKTLVQHGKIQRLHALIVVGAVGQFGIAPLPHKEVVQAEHLTADAAAAKLVSQFAGGSGLSGGGRPRHHDNVAAGGKDLIRRSADAAGILPLAQLHQSAGIAGCQVHKLTAHQTLGGAGINQSGNIAHRIVSLLPCGPAPCQSGRYTPQDICN